MITDSERLFCDKLHATGSKTGAVKDAGLDEVGTDPMMIANQLLARMEISEYIDALRMGVGEQYLKSVESGELLADTIISEQADTTVRQLEMELAGAGGEDSTPRQELQWIKRKAMLQGDYNTVMKCIDMMRKVGAETPDVTETTVAEVKKMDADQLRDFVLKYAASVRAQREGKVDG